MSYGRMVKEERRLQAEIGALLKRAEAVDEAEDARYGEDARGDPGGEGAPGGRAESDGRRAGPQAGPVAQPEGRQALQAGVR